MTTHLFTVAPQRLRDGRLLFGLQNGLAVVTPMPGKTPSPPERLPRATAEAEAAIAGPVLKRGESAESNAIGTDLAYAAEALRAANARLEAQNTSLSDQLAKERDLMVDEAARAADRERSLMDDVSVLRAEAALLREEAVRADSRAKDTYAKVIMLCEFAGVTAKKNEALHAIVERALIESCRRARELSKSDIFAVIQGMANRRHLSPKDAESIVSTIRETLGGKP